MKILITGANGQLGTDLVKALGHFDLIPLTHADIEITDENSVSEMFKRYKPDTIVNTAAFVRVDDCETDPDKAFLVNGLGARNIAVAASQYGARLIHISTDYIFGGEAEPRAIPYTESDTPAPVNIYGKSKLAGEDFVRQLCRRHMIIRTSGLCGVAGSSGKGGNFVETILRLGQERNEITVVTDQVFSPTFTGDLAGKIAQLIETGYYGTFHATNRGTCSWYEFAVEILRLAGLETRVIPVTSDEYPQKATRPGFSVLDNHRLRLLGMDDMRNWQEALKDYMREKGHLKGKASRPRR